MKLNRQINVTLLISMGLFLAISIGASVYSLNHLKNAEMDNMRETLLIERKNKLRDVVANAYSVLETANFYEPAQKAIAGMRFGENQQNYFYVVDMSGIFWVNPARPKLVGTDGSGLKDANGRPYISEIISDAMIKGEGFMEYDEVKSGTGEPSRKLVHFKRFKDWEWVVCADMFIDDIDAVLFSNQQEIENTMVQQIVFLSVLGGLALIIIITMSNLFFRRKLVMPLARLTDAVDRIANGKFDVETDIRSSQEINRLVDAVQRMQNSFAVAYRRLKAATDSLNANAANGEKEPEAIIEAGTITRFKLKNAG